MTDAEAKRRALALVEQDPLIMLLGTAGPDGAPEIKAMMKTRRHRE